MLFLNMAAVSSGVPELLLNYTKLVQVSQSNAPDHIVLNQFLLMIVINRAFEGGTLKFANSYLILIDTKIRRCKKFKILSKYLAYCFLKTYLI